MINFHLPDFYNFYYMYQKLVQTKNEHPEYFIDGFNIGSIYGCFPGQIWNGGRAIVERQTDLDNVEKTIRGINILDIPVRFTYTNCLLTDEHVHDRYCNAITDIANESKMNEIIINTKVIEDYIRSRYDNFKYILSTTKQIRDLELIDDLLDDDKYAYAVIAFSDNRKFELLEKMRNKSKIEILINTVCDINCPRMLKHYEVLAKEQLGMQMSEDEYNFSCNNPEKDFYETMKSPSVIKVEELQRYIDMGINNFKIEGRTRSIVDVIDFIVYYCVKPEHQNMVRNYLLKTAL